MSCLSTHFDTNPKPRLNFLPLQKMAFNGFVTPQQDLDETGSNATDPNDSSFASPTPVLTTRSGRKRKVIQYDDGSDFLQTVSSGIRIFECRLSSIYTNLELTLSTPSRADSLPKPHNFVSKIYCRHRNLMYLRSHSSILNTIYCTCRRKYEPQQFTVESYAYSN